MVSERTQEESSVIVTTRKMTPVYSPEADLAR